MNSTIIHIGILFLFALPWGVSAQLPDSTEQDDPFRNDPFFTKPFPELLKTPPGEWTTSENLRHSYKTLNQKGLDNEEFFGNGIYNAPLVYQMYPLLPATRYNRVDGLTLGFRKDRMQWNPGNNLFDIPTITLTGSAGYAFGSDKWQYSLGLQKLFGRQQHLMIGGEFHEASTTDDYWRAGLNETTLTALATSHDFMDYYTIEGFGLYMAFRTKKMLELSTSFNNDDYRNLTQNTDFSFFGKDKSFRPNQPVDSTDNLKSISIGASINPKNLIMTPFFTFSTDLFVEFADLGSFDNSFDFNRYEAETKLFFRLDRATVLNIRLKGGSITGRAPVQRLYELGGIGSLRARDYKEFSSNNQMLLANTELQIGRPDWSGSGWIDLSNFYISLFLDSGWTRFEEEQINRNNPFKGFKNFKLDDVKNDFGIGIGSNLVRAEIAWPTENLGNSPTLWLRFNPTF